MQEASEQLQLSFAPVFLKNKKVIQFHKSILNSETRTTLISALGGRFPRARLQSPRHYVPVGLSARAVPAGVAACRSNQWDRLF
jgi:hypothetical protein